MNTDEDLPIELQLEAKRVALEAITRLLIWATATRTARQRGLRATAIVYCYAPHLINGATLEDIAAEAGCSRQAVHKVVVNFRKAMKAMPPLTSPLFPPLRKTA